LPARLVFALSWYALRHDFCTESRMGAPLVWRLPVCPDTGRPDDGAGWKGV